MNVLYITLSYPHPGQTGSMYSDLMEEFASHGHEICVVAVDERKHGRPTRLVQEGRLPVLRVRTGNIFNVNPIEKGISLVALPWLLKRAINKYLRDYHYDLILFATPPVTFARAIRGLKGQQPGAKAYLMLKDIFPQNARDLGMIRNSLLFEYFRRQERSLYAASDLIGCMSPANVRFLLEHNPEIAPSRVEVLPNTLTPGDDLGLLEPGTFRDQHGIPKDAVVALWGGNMGIPQGMDFLVQVIEANRERRDVHFLLVGDGTERARIAKHVASSLLKNVTMLERLPRNDYAALARECDIGLICLDRRFTIPNFPSRVLAYMDIRMPILAALDPATDLGEMLENAGAGLWSLAGDLDAFQKNLDRLVADRELRMKMGAAGRQYFEQHFTSVHAYQIIASHFAN